MEDETCTEVYRLHVWICRISPMIWRRLLVLSDSSIADLHYTLQTAFGWGDEHLHRFHVHGQDYGVYRAGGIMFTADSSAVRLSSFQFRLNESFRYGYDFVAGWEHQVRVEGRLALDDKGRYPRCIGGRRRTLPEDCGGPLDFIARRDEVPMDVEELLEEIQDDLEADDLQAIRDRTGYIEELHEWLSLDRFDRRAVNHQLEQYAMSRRPDDTAERSMR